MDNTEIKHLPSLVVLPSGFVYIGYASVHKDEGLLSIDNCKNVRTWGTSKGLGQLAIEGKQSDTQLDDVGSLLTPYPQQVLQIIPISESACTTFDLTHPSNSSSDS